MSSQEQSCIETVHAHSGTSGAAHHSKPLQESLQKPEAPNLAAARLVQEAVDEDVEQPARRVERGRHAARVAQEEARAPQACRRISVA